MKPRRVWVIVLATILVGMLAGGTVLALAPAAADDQEDHLIVGTPRDDILVGTRDWDGILGKGGDDTLRGLRGGDILQGQRGSDKIFGGRGDDNLYGGPGKDRIFSAMESGFDSDWVSCGKGYDHVRADKWDDVSRNCEDVSRVRP